MANPDPNNLGHRVTARNTNWLDMCTRAWGSEFYAPDHRVYEFSNGVKKDSTDKYLTGIYGVRGENYIMVADNYPDMRTALDTEGPVDILISE
jgi:hypothetical protein